HLLHPRDFHRVLEPQLLLELRADLLVVELPQTGRRASPNGLLLELGNAASCARTFALAASLAAALFRFPFRFRTACFPLWFFGFRLAFFSHLNSLCFSRSAQAASN